jgi:hypothetical protein
LMFTWNVHEFYVISQWCFNKNVTDIHYHSIFITLHRSLCKSSRDYRGLISALSFKNKGDYHEFRWVAFLKHVNVKKKTENVRKQVTESLFCKSGNIRSLTAPLISKTTPAKQELFP